MTKKKKRKAQVSKDPFLSLGFVNVCIYFILIVVVVSISISPILILMAIKNAISFSDPTVIATRTDNASILFSLPFSLTFLLVTFVPFVRLLEQNCPIVGKLSHRDGYSPFKEEFIPLVKMIFREFFTDKIVKIMLCLLLPFLLLSSLSLFSRIDLHSDYTVTERNLFNQVSDSHSTSEYEELTISVYSTSGRGGKTWGYSLEITTNDDDKIYIKSGYFKGKNNIDVINTMLEIKSLFNSESINIENKHKLSKVINYLDLNIEEKQKLEELFSTP